MIINKDVMQINYTLGDLGETTLLIMQVLIVTRV